MRELRAGVDKSLPMSGIFGCDFERSTTWVNSVEKERTGLSKAKSVRNSIDPLVCSYVPYLNWVNPRVDR